MQKVILILALLGSIASKAQTVKDSTGRIFLFSSLGLSLLSKGVNPFFTSSVQTATGVGCKASPHSAVAVTLSFDSYGYKKSGTSYNLDGTLRGTALALFYTYTFGIKSWQPYVKAGGGGIRLSVPTVAVNPGMTNIRNESETLGLLLAEAGLQVRLHARYSLFFGTESRWIAKSSLLSDASLRPVTVKIGLISSF
ncbi:MAG: hypothetical protein M3Y85_10295 [Bacteroidota bacterium]|nr:hypothetical protein [Bacteroidota bacterium]